MFFIVFIKATDDIIVKMTIKLYLNECYREWYHGGWIRSEVSDQKVLGSILMLNILFFIYLGNLIFVIQRVIK